MSLVSHRPHAFPEDPTTRRHFLMRIGRAFAVGATALIAGPVPRTLAAEDRDETTVMSKKLLETSEYAYISPLRSNGHESSCHAELWYAWLDDSVLVIVSRDGWKATSLARNLEQARIWIGNHGRWKTWLGSRNEAFRKAPHFDARVERVTDPEALDQLLQIYEVKYPAEIADWRDRMRDGFADGSRVLLRYRPSSALSLGKSP